MLTEGLLESVGRFHSCHCCFHVEFNLQHNFNRIFFFDFSSLGKLFRFVVNHSSRTINKFSVSNFYFLLYIKYFKLFAPVFFLYFATLFHNWKIIFSFCYKNTIFLNFLESWISLNFAIWWNILMFIHFDIKFSMSSGHFVGTYVARIAMLDAAARFASRRKSIRIYHAQPAKLILTFLFFVIYFLCSFREEIFF